MLRAPPGKYVASFESAKSRPEINPESALIPPQSRTVAPRTSMLSLPGRAPSKTASPHRNARLESSSLMFNDVQKVTLQLRPTRGTCPKVDIPSSRRGELRHSGPFFLQFTDFQPISVWIKSERTGLSSLPRSANHTQTTVKEGGGRVLWTKTAHALVYSRPLAANRP